MDSSLDLRLSLANNSALKGIGNAYSISPKSVLILLLLLLRDTSTLQSCDLVAMASTLESFV